MCVEMKMIVKNDTNISSIHRGAGALINLGRCLAEIIRFETVNQASSD